MATIKDLTGQKFGYLTVVSLAYMDRFAYWNCICKCYNNCIVRSSRLMAGDTKSCGCLAKEVLIKRSTSHNMSNTRFYIVHRNMVNRCCNLADPAYSNYGGRGITVCDRWMKFENFRDDMYESYFVHYNKYNGNTSLDRIDVNGNYDSSNCRWATDQEQNNNRRSTVVTIDKKEHDKWKAQIFTALHNVIRRKYPRTTLTEKYIGLDTNNLFKHLESQWTIGMSWDNYGLGSDKWNIDHIIGCNNFDLSKEEDRYICWNYKNLKPLWCKDNISKSKSRGTF